MKADPHTHIHAQIALDGADAAGGEGEDVARGVLRGHDKHGRHEVVLGVVAASVTVVKSVEAASRRQVFHQFCNYILQGHACISIFYFDYFLYFYFT